LRHRPQRDKGAQFVVGRFDEFTAGFEELINERFRLWSTRRIAAAQNEKVPKLERRVDAAVIAALMRAWKAMALVWPRIRKQ
jgi:hypothetical protein